MNKIKNPSAVSLGNDSWLKRKSPEEFKHLQEISKKGVEKKLKRAIYRNKKFLEANGYKVTKV